MKDCPPGKYYCTKEKKCMPIPKGKYVGAHGWLRPDPDDNNGRKSKKNGNKNGNGHSGTNGSSSSNGNGNGNGSNGGGMSESTSKSFEDFKESLKQARKNVGADKCWDGYKAKGTKKKGGKEVPNCVKEGKKKGLWDNIHAKRKRGEKPAKPGDKDYPKTLNVESAWQRKEGKNKTGGLNEKGRKSYERENPGSDLKAPQPEGGPRKRSFCARMGGVKGPMKDEKGRPTRKALALRKWKC